MIEPIKNRPKIATADYEALPDAVRGVYSGDSTPELRGRETMLLGGRLYINGYNFELVDGSHRHSHIAICPTCHRLSIIYAKGQCKACAQKFLYRKRQKKKEKCDSPIVVSRRFRREWPVNLICALDHVRYDPETYPYDRVVQDRLVRELSDERCAMEASILLRHYRDGVQYTDIAEEQHVSKQAIHMMAQRHLRKLRKMWMRIKTTDSSEG